MSALLVALACNGKPEGGGVASAEPIAASAAPRAGQSGMGSSSTPVASAVPTPAGSELPSSAPSASTAGAPAVDPALLARMQKVAAACSWNGKVMDEDCKALQGWHEYLFEPINDHQEELMRLLEDKNRKIVFLAAAGLATDGITGTRDPVLAKVLFDALEREKEPAMCIGITLQASHVKTAEFGLEDRARRILKELPVARCRAEFAGAVLTENPQLYDLVVELAKTDQDPEIRSSAAHGLTYSVRDQLDRQKNNCKVWGELIDDSGKSYESVAASLVGKQGPNNLTLACTEQWPRLLARAEALGSASQLQAVGWVSGTCAILEQRKLDDSSKTKATAVLRKIVEGTGNLDFARADALNCLRRFDADAKTFAKSFESDPSEKVQNAAKRILETTP